jgi:hypothetical protein
MIFFDFGKGGSRMKNMCRISFFGPRGRFGLLVMTWLIFFPAIIQADDRASIQAEDVDGHAVAVNGSGHYTVVIYTNPDLEETSRQVTRVVDAIL